MDTLGSCLKRQRESSGYALKEVAEQIKIRIGYLEAMEEDDLSALPDGPYAKGFVKAYAQFLGLEPEKVWNQYGWKKTVEETKQDLHLPKEFALGWLLVIAGFVLGIAIVATFAQYASKGKIDSGDYTRQAIDRLHLVPESTATESAITESLLGPAAILSEQLVLQIRVTGRSWIVVTADTDTVLSGEVRPGAEIRLVARNRFTVSLGKTQAAEIFFNGNKLEAFSRPGKGIFRAEINQKNYVEYLK